MNGTKKMCEKNIGKKQHGESVNTNTHPQITNKNGSFRADIALTMSSVRAFLLSHWHANRIFQVLHLTY